MWSKIFNSTQYLAKYRKLIKCSKASSGGGGEGEVELRFTKVLVKCQVLHYEFYSDYFIQFLE